MNNFLGCPMCCSEDYNLEHLETMKKLEMKLYTCPFCREKWMPIEIDENGLLLWAELGIGAFNKRKDPEIFRACQRQKTLMNRVED